MTELPQATSRRELRDRESAARARPVRVSRSVRAPRRRVRSALLSLSSMLFVAALAISVTVPANVFSSSSSAQAAADVSGTTPTASALSRDAQTVTVSGSEAIDVTARDGFQSQSHAEILAAQYAASGSQPGGKGSVRWPFTGKPSISSPYGPRDPICSGGMCTDSTHHGTDFLPGNGAPVFAIANGVVSGHSESGSDLGNYVTIQSKVGRDVITSIYGHMQAGSSPMVVGQVVRAGEFLGLVGATGVASGPHLHLGIAVNGVETDPVPWMLAHVSGGR